MGQTVSGDPDWLIHGEGDPVRRVGQLLAQKPALLILDNFESVLGRNPEMPQEELQGVLAAVYQWGSGQWTDLSEQWSVDSEQWGAGVDYRGIPVLMMSALLHPRCAAISPARVGGAGRPGAGGGGAGRQVHRPGEIPRQDLVDLMRHLGGHPLSLNLVLPHLRRYTPRQLMDSFEALLPGFVDGKAEERNESLAVSLDFSLRRLGTKRGQRCRIWRCLPGAHLKIICCWLQKWIKKSGKRRVKNWNKRRLCPPKLFRGQDSRF
ncbi:MAG: hypothetical protein M5U34_36515 [Chloroflexi bacterium]|nr:hypothetical protein [Chloroflexota bacterium]